MMRLPRWSVVILVRLLSLSGLTTASGAGVSDLRIGLSFSTQPPLFSQAQLQPRLQDLSLDLDFFVQVANHELTIPIMPL